MLSILLLFYLQEFLDDPIGVDSWWWGSTESEHPRLIRNEIIFEVFQPNVTTIHQRHRRTDGRTTCRVSTTLCVASRVKKVWRHEFVCAQTGLTSLSIAQRLGYISVVELLKNITEVAMSPLTMDEKYKVLAPETMQEAAMSDSEEEGGCVRHLISIIL